MDRKRKLGALVLFNNLMQSSRKRQRKEMDDFDSLYDSLKEPDDVVDGENGDDIIGTIAYGTALATTMTKKRKLGLMPTPPCVGYGIRIIQISSVERCVHRSHSSSHTIVLRHSVQKPTRKRYGYRISCTEVHSLSTISEVEFS